MDLVREQEVLRFPPCLFSSGKCVPGIDPGRKHLNGSRGPQSQEMVAHRPSRGQRPLTRNSARTQPPVYEYELSSNLLGLRHSADTPTLFDSVALRASVAHPAAPRLWGKGGFGGGDRSRSARSTRTGGLVTDARKVESRFVLRVSVLRAMVTSAYEQRWIGPKRARVQLQARPIAEKALVILLIRREV